MTPRRPKVEAPPLRRKPPRPTRSTPGSPGYHPVPAPLSSAARGLLFFHLYIRKEITLDFPLNDLALLLVVASHGDAGATLTVLGQLTKSSQGSVSKNVRMLSKSILPPSPKYPAGKEVGYDLLRVEIDATERKRRRVFLTDKGWALIRVLESSLARGGDQR